MDSLSQFAAKLETEYCLDMRSAEDLLRQIIFLAKRDAQLVVPTN